MPTAKGAPPSKRPTPFDLEGTARSDGTCLRKTGQTAITNQDGKRHTLACVRIRTAVAGPCCAKARDTAPDCGERSDRQPEGTMRMAGRQSGSGQLEELARGKNAADGVKRKANLHPTSSEERLNTTSAACNMILPLRFDTGVRAEPVSPCRSTPPGFGRRAENKPPFPFRSATLVVSATRAQPGWRKPSSCRVIARPENPLVRFRMRHPILRPARYCPHRGCSPGFS